MSDEDVKPNSFIIGTDMDLNGEINLICVGTKKEGAIPNIIKVFTNEEARHLYDILIGKEKLLFDSQK